MAYPTYPTMPTYGNYIPPQAPTQSGMFYWVQSKQEAELYPVAPGNSVMFMDSNNMVIYMKTVNANREVMPLKVYDMVERKEVSPEPTRPAPDLSKYITRDELNDILSAYMTKKPPKKESVTNG